MYSYLVRVQTVVPLAEGSLNSVDHHCPVVVDI